MPLTLVTLWHPEKWLGVEKASALRSFPAVQRIRSKMEETRKEGAASRGANLTVEEFHERLVGNLGIPVDSLRQTWIPTDILVICLRAFRTRLIHTIEEQGSQARYRLEFRYDWGEDPNILGSQAEKKIETTLEGAGKVSIRQLWRNPVSARFGQLALPPRAKAEEEIANLVLGPFDPRETRRPGRLEFHQSEGIWWVSYDVPEAAL